MTDETPTTPAPEESAAGELIPGPTVAYDEPFRLKHTRRNRRTRRFKSGWRYRLALWLFDLSERVNPLRDAP